MPPIRDHGDHDNSDDARQCHGENRFLEPVLGKVAGVMQEIACRRGDDRHRNPEKGFGTARFG